jgi:hypothetical protein
MLVCNTCTTYSILSHQKKWEFRYQSLGNSSRKYYSRNRWKVTEYIRENSNKQSKRLVMYINVNFFTNIPIVDRGNQRYRYITVTNSTLHKGISSRQVTFLHSAIRLHGVVLNWLNTGQIYLTLWYHAQYLGQVNILWHVDQLLGNDRETNKTTAITR